MAKSYPLFFRDQRREIEFDFVWIGVFCESKALREAHHVGVDADGLLPESVAEYDIGRFSSHAGKAKKVVQSVRDFAIETLNDLAAAIVNRLGFVAIEVNFVDLAFELRQRF